MDYNRHSPSHIGGIAYQAKLDYGIARRFGEWLNDSHNRSFICNNDSFWLIHTASYFAVLPPPREVSPINLRRFSFTTLQTLDSNYDLSRAAFETDNATTWGGLQVALSASLPPNVVYNLTVYDVNDADGQIYNYVASISNAANIGSTNDVSTYTVASSNVTFNFTPQKIGEAQRGNTLHFELQRRKRLVDYRLHSPEFSQDLYTLLSPYFVNTVMVQNTAQLATILAGTPCKAKPSETPSSSTPAEKQYLYPPPIAYRLIHLIHMHITVTFWGNESTSTIGLGQA